MPNTNTPWSETDLIDLKAALDFGETIEEAAKFLCRSVEEVQAKVDEMKAMENDSASG